MKLVMFSVAVAAALLAAYITWSLINAHHVGPGPVTDLLTVLLPTKSASIEKVTLGGSGNKDVVCADPDGNQGTYELRFYLLEVEVSNNTAGSKTFSVIVSANGSEPQGLPVQVTDTLTFGPAFEKVQTAKVHVAYMQPQLVDTTKPLSPTNPINECKRIDVLKQTTTGPTREFEIHATQAKTTNVLDTRTCHLSTSHTTCF